MNNSNDGTLYILFNKNVKIIFGFINIKTTEEFICQLYNIEGLSLKNQKIRTVLSSSNNFYATEATIQYDKIVFNKEPNRILGKYFAFTIC